MDTVAIVGVGLIGGSFGLALRKAGFRGRLIGVSSPARSGTALDRGAIDEALPLAEGVAQADLVYLAQPIRRILETLAALDPWLRPGSLVTDAGQHQGEDCRAGPAGDPAEPVPGRASDGRQGEARRGGGGCGPVRGPDLRADARRRPRSWRPRRRGSSWAGSGPSARVTVMLAPEEHDRVVARTSHLPQLLSTALAVTLVSQLESADHLQVAGPGLADTLRLAASSYEVWGDILATNTAEIDAALAAFIAEIEELRARLGSERTRDAFQAANDFAARLKR